MNRRQWLQAGVLGAAALGAVALVGPRPWSSHGADTAGTEVFKPPSAPTWNPDAEGFLRAVARVVLGPVCGGSTDEILRAVAGLKLAVSKLSPAAQGEVAELLSLLTFAPTRVLATGVWADWSQATDDEVAAFLQRWRHSRLSLLQSGYHALHDLVLGSWYADQQTWAGIGYPGPPPIGAAA